MSFTLYKNKKLIENLIKYLKNITIDKEYEEHIFFFEEIKNKYEINDINEQISVRKALYFVRDVFDLDIIYYDKFLRYARKFNILIEEKDKEDQRNWKHKVTYQGIFEMFLTPLYQVLKQKEKL